MSDSLEDAFVDLAMLMIGGAALAAGVVAVAILRALAGAEQLEPQPDEYDAVDGELPW